MSILTTLISPLAGLAKNYLSNKAEQAKAKHEAKMNVIQNDAKMAEASASSWKDEFWTLVLSVPIFMVGYAIVVGDMTVVDRVQEAFVALGSLPEWYQYLLFIAISASFGIKGVDKLMNMRK